MAKYSGSYDDLIRGVSQQIPQDRREGQHTDQVNMISDPVRGLCRRHGSVMEHEYDIGSVNPSFINDTLNDAKKYRSFDFVVDDNRYTLFYRNKTKPTNSQSPFLFCLNKETKRFIPVVLNSPDAVLTSIANAGVSALTSIGRYVVMAGNGIKPVYNTIEKWDTNNNKRKGAVWVLSGNYSVTYKITISLKNTATNVTALIEAEYTTKSASYPELLNTSDILWSDPEYQKKVNDRTNAYNSAVTQWIGLAAADIRPKNIVEKLVESLEDKRTLAGLTLADLVFTISNSTIGIEAIGNWTIENLTSSDNGDETTIRAVHMEVSSPELVTAEHFPNKVVRVSPKRNDEKDSYYLIATPRDGLTGIELEEVRWVETAGTEIVPSSMFIIATVENGTLYVSSTASGLETLSGITEVPEYEPSKVGDLITSPIPYFFDYPITYLSVFQDRLVVGSNSVLSFSRPGDYFNFFRQTVLTVAANDPVEIYSLGSEDDTLIASAIYDQNLVIFGRRKQYVIQGRQVLTPQTSNITVFGSYEDAVECEPIALGNYIFYSQLRNGFASLNQIQPGQIVESPETYNTSQQISRYLIGQPIEMFGITSPNVIFFRTEGLPYGVYLYNYLDTGSGSERLYDSWSKWEWDERLGPLVGMTFDRGNLLFAMLRYGKDRSNVDRWYISLERFVMDTEISDKPYMDSIRTLNYYNNTPSNNSFLNPNSNLENINVAFDRTVRQEFLGQPLENLDNLLEAYTTTEQLNALWVGYPFKAYVVPTNPYIKDKDGKAITNGILTLQTYSLSLTNTGGLEFYVEKKGGTKQLKQQWNGRQIGRQSAELGIQPISTGTVIAPIGQQNTKFNAYIESSKWLPFTINQIEWTGQFFYSTKRG